MALIFDSIPQLNGGVSRMADITRLDSQLEEQVNGLSDIINSVGTRPPAAVLAELTNAQLGPCITFETDIAGETLWVVAYDSGSAVNFTSFESDGTEHTIATPPAVSAYLDTGSVADGDIQILQAGGRIFVNCRQTPVAMDSTLTPTRLPEVLIWARQSAGLIKPVVSLTNAIFTPNATLAALYTALTDSVPTDGSEVLVVGSAPESSINEHSTAKLAEQLINEANDGLDAVYTAHWSGNVTAGYGFDAWVWSYPDDTENPITDTDKAISSLITGIATNAAAKDHVFVVSDGLGDQALRVAGPATVDALESLPRKGAPVGFHVKVVGLNSEEEDDYYVYYDGDNWKETPAQAVEYIIDGETMPWELTVSAPETLVFNYLAWGQRTTGDTTSAPDPLFVGKSIQSMAVHKNRLALVAEDSVSLSEDSAFLNFFPSTLRQVLDSDPIEFDLSADSGESDRPQLARHAVSTPGGLLILGDNVQSVVTSADDFWAPARVSNNVLSKVEMDSSVSPVRVGNEVYFLARAGENTTLWSYAVLPGGGFVAEDVSATVPRYLPTSIAWMKGSFNEKILLLGDKDDPTTVYVYRWYSEGEEKLMRSWSKWTFPFDVNNGYFKDGNFIAACDMGFGGANYFTFMELALDYPGEFPTDGINWPFCLDYKMHADDNPGWIIAYDAPTNITSYTGVEIAGSDQATTRMIGAIFDDVTGVIEIQTDVDVGAGAFDLVGDTTGANLHVVFGFPYEFSVQLSKIYRKRSNGRAIVPVQTGRTQLRKINPLLTRSGPLDVRITPEGRAAVTKVLPAFDVGDAAVYPFVPPPFRRATVDVHGDASKIKIELLSAYLTPVTVTGYDWEALYHNRARMRA